MTGDETALRELLHRATPDLGSLQPPADLRPARSSRRPTVIAVSAAVAVVATVAFVIGLARQLGHSPEASNQGSARHPLTVRIQLDQTTATAGRAIRGIAIVTNAATHPLTITDCNGTWIQVGLSNADVTYRAVWDLCYSTTVLQPGTTRIPIRVDTTYERCTPHANSATTQMPACERGNDARLSMPPLPPGTYKTTTGILEPEGVDVPTPEPIQVILTS
jgi:hypothetical protein